MALTIQEPQDGTKKIPPTIGDRGCYWEHVPKLAICNLLYEADGEIIIARVMERVQFSFNGVPLRPVVPARYSAHHRHRSPAARNNPEVVPLVRHVASPHIDFEEDQS